MKHSTATATADRAPQLAALTPMRGRLLQRQCACGAHSPGGEACGDCKKKKQKKDEEGTLQRKATGAAAGTAPPIVHDVLNSAGRPLDSGVRTFMEPRFGQDFSRVRVHTDSMAAASAGAVNASAYTVGSHIVFGPGQYRPGTEAGHRLLAHELTHVVQQQGQPGSVQEKLEIGDVDTQAEREADRTATSVLADRTPAPIRTAPEGPALRRKFWGGAVGAVIGGIAGAALGSLLGPIGAVVGGLLLGGLGALIGHALTDDKTEDKEGTPLARISRLLSTGILDWAVTDKEAHAAMEILRDLAQKSPLQFFDTVTLMKFSGAWGKLKKELPAEDLNLLQIYFEGHLLSPEQGLTMPLDTLKVDFGNDPNSKHQDPPLDVQVDGDGTAKLPYLKENVRVLGLLPDEAANAIAKAYIDGQLYWNVTIGVTRLKRGGGYSSFGNVTAPMRFPSTYNILGTPEGDKYQKRRRFADYIATLVSTDNFTITAKLFYYDEMDKRLDAFEKPEDMWKFALSKASEKPPESPLRPWLDFVQRMREQTAAAPPKEKERMQSAMNRFMEWFNTHAEDKDLAQKDPAKIWSQAYLSAFKEEMKTADAAFLKKRREQEEAKDWDKAVAKFDDALKLLQTKVWATRQPEYVKGAEEISQTTGDPVQVSYLVQPSDAEKVIRNVIATDFLDQIVHRMGEPGFTKTTATDDFVAYLNKNPEKLKAFQLTASHPQVERFEDEIDIPGWQTAAEIIVSLIPIVGEVVAAKEVISGEDLFGHPMTTTDRTIMAVAVLLPIAGKLFKYGKAAVTVATVAKDYRMSQAEAKAFFRITAGIAPGTTAAKLFGEGAQEIRAGRSVKNPEVLRQMEQVLKDVGLTEKETAKALTMGDEAVGKEATQVAKDLPGAGKGVGAGDSALANVQKQTEAMAKDEMKALGNVSKETEEMLVKNEPLRHALVENSLAATALKKCASPCFPPGATTKQVERLESFLEKMKKTGNYNEDALRKYLYDRRADLDKALDDIIGGTWDSKRLDEMVAFLDTPGKAVKNITSKEARFAKISFAHDIGEFGGKVEAGKEGLFSVKFENPFRDIGGFGQGFDDVMAKGYNLDKDLIYILEYKGAGAKLDPGQMELEWVIKNIQRLYKEGGPEGRAWAQRLSTALSEGRLRGKAYSTPVKDGVAEATEVLKEWFYPKSKVNLVP